MYPFHSHKWVIKKKCFGVWSDWMGKQSSLGPILALEQRQLWIWPREVKTKAPLLLLFLIVLLSLPLMSQILNFSSKGHSDSHLSKTGPCLSVVWQRS